MFRKEENKKKKKEEKKNISTEKIALRGKGKRRD